MSQASVISASILAADFGRLAAEVEAVVAGGADWIHVDVMDGHFVPNLTLGPDVTAAVRAVTDRPLDVHLMVDQPDRWVEPFAAAGADWLGVQVEAATHLHRVIQKIGEAGVKASVVLNPATSLTAIENVLGDVDMVLIMTVNPGFSGQDFLASMLPKVRRCREMIDATGRDVRLAVDGGVGPHNIADLYAAGADVFVAGSAIFGGGDPGQGVRRLRRSLGD